ncbi:MULTISPECIES: carbamoyltransferase [Rhodomicrobium]|uniref:carbamoyltransferase family protein n=1 Tax=Rhodomicrobium TaxID=1068 RepID=UPI000B4A579D|nr:MULTISPECIES: carbamoyltransferase [Rhodomicrobium]
MRILGISAFYHDSAAALVEDGRIVAAAQEERFTRKKHDAAFPEHAIRYCLDTAGVDLDEVDHVAFFEKPLVKFERLLETYLANAPGGFQSFRTAIPVWIKEKLFQKSGLTKSLKPFSATGTVGSKKLLFAGHHQSHAASAFFASPFEEAVVLTLDGVGEWTTTSVSIGRGNTLETKREIKFPHSLGLLYSAFTYYTGFKVNSGEYKVMGLAPYGEPRYYDLIMKHIIDVKPDGSFWLDLSYFNYMTGLTMTSAKFHELFGAPPRDSEGRVTQREMDLAASIQKVTEEIMLRMTRELSRSYGIRNLCMAGGVALNCVANGKILRDGHFDRMWIQPAAGDAGGALGAALAASYVHLGQRRHVNGSLDGMQGSYLGPAYEQSDIERRLAASGARFEVHKDGELMGRTVDSLTAGDAVGWFQGRMEFGPRALGARSILGDPRNPEMQKTLNLKIKYRESFRPFAPAVLREDVADYFELDEDSPYMLFVSDVKRNRRRSAGEGEEKLFGIDKLNLLRSDIPAVTHVDYSARIQTVHEETNPRFRALLGTFKERTGYSVLVNTSFNVRGEPIVCTPEDAFRCFMGTEMETLVVGDCILRKDAQDQSLAKDYKDKFELD